MMKEIVWDCKNKLDSKWLFGERILNRQVSLSEWQVENIGCLIGGLVCLLVVVVKENEAHSQVHSSGHLMDLCAMFFKGE